MSPWEATTAQIEDELRLGHPLLDPLNCFCCRVVAYSQRCRDLFRTSEIMFYQVDNLPIPFSQSRLHLREKYPAIHCKKRIVDQFPDSLQRVDISDGYLIDRMGTAPLLHLPAQGCKCVVTRTSNFLQVSRHSNSHRLRNSC